jgi:hypothetical protein
MWMGGDGASQPTIMNEEKLLEKNAQPRFSSIAFMLEEMGISSKVVVNSLQMPMDFNYDRIYHFFHVMRHLTEFMVFAWLICLDSFLFMVTFLPVRFLSSLLRHLSNFFRRLLLRPVKSRDMAFWVIWKADCFRIMLISITVGLLAVYVQLTQHYHWIRMQSTFKLYVIFNILQVFDRLGCSFGDDLLNTFFNNLLSSGSSTLLYLKKEASIIRWIKESILTPCVVLAYLILHSYVLVIHAVALNVAINSNDSSLIVLLVSSNFVEIKGSAFKNYDKKNLFQIAASGTLSAYI